MPFSKGFIRQVVESTNLVDLISDHGITLKRAGTNYKGLCPFHAEKTPSFNVNPLRGFFHCFGCSTSGDAIKFLTQYDRLSFSEAVEELAKRASIPLEIESGNSRLNNLDEDRGLRCLREAASYYRNNLVSPEGATAMEYLRQRAVPENMQDHFQLGVSPDGAAELRLGRARRLLRPARRVSPWRDAAEPRPQDPIRRSGIPRAVPRPIRTVRSTARL